MKIKGVYTSGPLKGKPLPYSDTELVSEAVKDAFIAKSPKGTKRLVYGVQVERIDVTSVRLGLSNKTLNDPRTIIASGTVSYKLHVLAGDRLKKADPIRFSIKFKEAKDEHSLPDVEIIEYKEES